MRALVFVDDQPRNFPGMVQAASHLGGALSLTCVWYSRHSSNDRHVWNKLRTSAARADMKAVESQARCCRLTNLPDTTPPKPASMRLTLALQAHLKQWGGKHLEEFRVAELRRCGTIDPATQANVRQDIADLQDWRAREA